MRPHLSEDARQTDSASRPSGRAQKFSSRQSLHKGQCREFRKERRVKAFDRGKFPNSAVSHRKQGTKFRNLAALTKEQCPKFNNLPVSHREQCAKFPNSAVSHCGQGSKFRNLVAVLRAASEFSCGKLAHFSKPYADIHRALSLRRPHIRNYKA